MSKKSPNPPATRQQAATVRTTTQTVQFSGPLPHPEILARYDAVIPGAAARIVAMAENDSKHLQEMERTSLEGTFKERRLGQALGLIVALAGFGTTIALAALGQGTAAGIVGSTTLVSLVSVFVVGRIYPSKE